MNLLIMQVVRRRIFFSSHVSKLAGKVCVPVLGACSNMPQKVLLFYQTIIVIGMESHNCLYTLRNADLKFLRPIILFVALPKNDTHETK